MSTSNCPETPRQKMIGMMYLFYTALLALNVSNEVIEAFIYVNESLQSTAVTYREKSDQIYSDISQMYETQPEKFRVQMEKAKQVRAGTDSLFNAIEFIKFEIMKKSTGTDTISNIKYVKKQDDVNAANEVMTAELGPRLGWKLEEQIIGYREMLLGIVAADTAGAGKFLKNTIISSLSTEPRQGKHDDSPKPWPETLTKGMPLVATYALLTKLQADLRNVETDVYAYLIGDAEKLDIKISELEALVAAPGAVMPGSRFFGRVFIGAKDTTMTPTIFVTYSEPYYDSTLVNGKWEFKRVAGKNYHSLKLDETGAGVIDTTFGASGGFGGVAVYESNLGPIIKPFKHMYSVGSSSGAITPTKMMVLYAGLPNPIKFAASGGADSRPTLSASGGLRVVSTGGNTATITPPASMIGQTVTLSVSAIGADGSVSRGTSESFVIKPLPSPRISLGGSMGGRKSIDALLSGTLEAKPDATFVFQGVQYTVKSFSLSYTVSGQYMTRTVYGTSINSDPAVAQIIRGLGRGTAVSIESVDVVAPDGQRSIPGPSFTIL